MMEISIVVPAYLEAGNLVNILPALNQALAPLQAEYEILVVDTAEPMDDTKGICCANHAVYINRRGGNLYGDAVRTGFECAEGRYIAVMDADGSHNPYDIPRLYKRMKRQDPDVVIGSRYCRGGHTENNFILRFMSWILNVAYRLLFGLKVKDVSDSFRMYQADQIKRLALECDNFDIVEEILIQLNCRIRDFRAVEIPITFSKRAEGKSKRDLIKFIKSYLKTIRRLLAIQKKCKKK